MASGQSKQLTWAKREAKVRGLDIRLEDRWQDQRRASQKLRFWRRVDGDYSEARQLSAGYTLAVETEYSSDLAERKEADIRKARKSGLRRAVDLKNAAAAWQQLAVKEADKLTQKHPNWSCSEIARSVNKRLGRPVMDDTVRRFLAEKGEGRKSRMPAIDSGPDAPKS